MLGILKQLKENVYIISTKGKINRWNFLTHQMQGYPRVTHLLAPFLKFEFIVSAFNWLHQCLQCSTFKCYSINKSTRRRFSKLKLNLKNDNRRNRRRREINKTSLCQRQTKQSFVSLLLRRWWSFKFEENCFEEKNFRPRHNEDFFSRQDEPKLNKQ